MVEEPIEILQDDTTFLAVEDGSVDGLKIGETWKSREIYFLPVRIYQSYPNLIGIYAGGKKIKEISKKNFQNLFKLEYLFLESNEIRKVKSDTFEGLIKLKVVNLGELMIDKAGKPGALLSIS